MPLTGLTNEELHRKYLEAAQNTQPGGFYPTGIHNPHLNQVPITIELPRYNLEEGAWDVPVSQLVDLWTVRFGSKWVKDEELDEFYKITMQRLRPLNKLESHYVNGHDVHRIVE